MSSPSGSIFQAAPSSQSPYPFFSNLASLTWNACTTLTLSNRLHTILIPMINPALNEPPASLTNLRVALFSSGEARNVQFKTPQGALIDGVFFPPRNSANGTKAILLALGAGGTYEKIANPDDAASHFVSFIRENFGDETGLLAINYEGIAESRGSASMNNWDEDIYSAYEFLLDQGYSEVLLYGHSLGAHLSLKACQKIFAKHQTILPVVADRGFSDSGTLIRHYMGGRAVGIAAQGALAYAGAASTAPLLTNQNVLLINATDDPVVATPASLTQRYATTRGVKTLTISGSEQPFSSHTRPFNQGEAQKVITFIKGALNIN